MPHPFENAELMANQRDPNKKQLRAWMHVDDIDLIRGKAESLGIPVSELILRLTETLKEENERNRLKNQKWKTKKR
jgi:hypothetical protein